MRTQRKKVKIVMTVGPASEKPKVLDALIASGVNVVRFNFSHGDHEEHRRRMVSVRRSAKRNKKHVALLQDLGGPKIRIGDFEDGAVTIVPGDTLTLSTKKCVGTQERVYINYARLPREVGVGQAILLDDGTKRLEVVRVTDTEVITRVVVGGLIRSRRGVNIPGAHLSVSSLTAKDRRDVLFGVDMDVDFFALSFVRSAKDIMQLRRLLTREGSQAKIIAKIETQEAVADIDAIISAADGIMVARGDLAVEVPAENVPHYQKMIVKKCNTVGKPVIVATQMLESMIQTPVPTRAEVADVTNAILDGTDAIMLSAETAIGAYPVEAVQMMASIARRTGRDMTYRHVEDDREHTQRTVNAVARSVIQTADDIDAVAIIALTDSGFTARKVSRYRPRQPIIVLSPHETVCREIMLSFGCYPRKIKRDFTSLIEAGKEARAIVLREKIAQTGDRIVIVAGIPFGEPGTTNVMFVETV